MLPKFGIIGLPNVGKSTFFCALSKREGLSANFPFSTIKPNTSMVPVPDDRLEQLNACVQTERIVPTTIPVVDIAGLVQGASEGEGLGNQFLATIREVDVLIHVVRCFDHPTIVHVAGDVDPVFDREVINQELRFADVAMLKRKLEKVGRVAKTAQQEAVKHARCIQRFLDMLEGGKDGRDVATDAEEEKWVRGWQLLTRKPMMYVANIDEATLGGKENRHLIALQAVMGDTSTEVLPICLELEAQIVALPEEEQQGYVEAYGLKETSLNKVLKAAYRLLHLLTYFTVGPQEIRAWTVAQGTLAPKAAGVIHTDFERGFIKAEVITFDDFIRYQSEERCRQAGKVAIEGKHYAVQDGDIIHFKCS